TVQPCHREVVVAGGVDLGEAGQHDLAVGLDGDAVGLVVTGRRRAAAGGRADVEGDGLDAGTVEGGVQAAVGVEPRHREVTVAGANDGQAGDDDLAVGLDRHRPALVVAAALDVDGLAAAGAEGGVEGAERGEAGDGDVGAAVGGGEGAGDDDLA